MIIRPQAVVQLAHESMINTLQLASAFVTFEGVSHGGRLHLLLTECIACTKVNLD
jgi:hypothetical protein